MRNSYLLHLLTQYNKSCRWAKSGVVPLCPIHIKWGKCLAIMPARDFENLAVYINSCKHHVHRHYPKQYIPFLLQKWQQNRLNNVVQYSYHKYQRQARVIKWHAAPSHFEPVWTNKFRCCFPNLHG